MRVPEPTPSNNAAVEGVAPLFRPGENCWRVEQADRFKMLVDGEAYFSVLRKAILNARQSIFILGWDIDSRMQLVPGGADDGFPAPLAAFLHAVVASRRQLRIYVLSWDFAMLYAFEREWLPVFKMGWRAHRRFAFKQDGRHPIGGSHHQKIVLIDDRLAFVGGLDLTRSRWDTSAHAADEPRRRDPNGAPYGPFHDVQVMFDGAAARAIGELVRERWLRASMRRVAILSSRMQSATHDPWPADCEPDIADGVKLAICRTEPEYAGRPAVQEVRQFYVDAIARARRYIFCENQYFTSGIVGAALRARLEDPEGPEVAILSRKVEGGWLQEATMGTLRARLHRELLQTQGAARYRIYCPHVPGLGDACVNVHSKVMFTDDDLLFVGSANLNNRSMVLDTECNVAIDARSESNPAVGSAIAGMRNRLLAEHLGVSEHLIAERLAQTGSLVATIDTLRGQPRTLVPHHPQVTPDIDALIPGEAVIDPETPMAADQLVTQFVPDDKRRPLSSRYAMLGVLVLMIAVAACLWRWTPLGGYLNVTALTRLTQQIAHLPFSPLIILAAYVLGGFVSLPITLMIAATGLVFGPVEGTVYALTGTLLSATTTYLTGRLLGRETVRRLAGPRINGMSERLAERGLIAMVILRVLPVAPFTVVNIIAGASQIGFRDYLLGTLIGMGPGIVITVAFAHQLVQAIRHPTWVSIVALCTIGLALVGLSVVLQRFFRYRDQQRQARKAREAREASAASKDDGASLLGAR